MKKIILLSLFFLGIKTFAIEGPYEWQEVKDVATYKQAEACWENCVRVERNISLNQAIEIANNDSNIDYFFFVKGYHLVLENSTKKPTTYRIFHKNDAVFFKGTPWFGEAKGYANAYVKNPIK